MASNTSTNVDHHAPVAGRRIGPERTPARPAIDMLVALILPGLLAAVVLAPAAVPSPAAEAAPSTCIVDITDVIGWWRGEDDLAAEVGAPLAGSAAFTDAVVGRGIDYDGATMTSTAGVASVDTGVSFETWIRPSDSGRVETIVSRWDDPGPDDAARSFVLQLLPGGLLEWSTDEVTLRRPERLIVAAPQLFDGSFHHVAATWNLDRFALFVDGIEVATRPSQGIALNPATSTAVRLGSKSGLGDPFLLRAVLDEATLWRRALTPAEIATIHAAGSGGKCTFLPVQQAMLLPIGGSGNSWFGFDVDVDDSTLVAGAPNANAPAFFSGAAYVFTRDSAGWSQQARLTALDGAMLDQFGFSVAVDADTAAIGAYGNNAGGTDSGTVYVFVRSGSTWTQQAKLIGTDTAAGDGFGYSVALDGETLLVGAPLDDDAGSTSGSAYVFTRSGTTWSQEAKLTAADAELGDNYGASVALAADVAVIGATGEDGAGINVGAAYVVTRSAATWSEQAKLVSPTPGDGDEFGSSVAVHAGTVAVGAPLDDDAAADAGAAYVFSGSGATWSLAASLVASDAAPDDRFGVSIDVHSARLVAGASFASPAGSQSGAAYVFDRVGLGWAQVTKLVAADAGAGDRFGGAVAASGPIAVGAYLADDLGGNAGAAYVFDD